MTRASPRSSKRRAACPTSRQWPTANVRTDSARRLYKQRNLMERTSANSLFETSPWKPPYRHSGAFTVS
jgi:hypothetical protein